MVQVKFLKNCGIYTVGDIAGFDKEKAGLLIERKIAEKHVPVKGKATDAKAN